jgi:hypothetical protein
MRFKDFISRQRITIFVLGVVAFVVTLLAAHAIGSNSIWSELYVDLAASSFTIIFTSFIIDYLSLREKSSLTQSAADLAEDEIRATCFRINVRLARLFGMTSFDYGRDNISDRQQARQYLDKLTQNVNNYLSQIDFSDDKHKINKDDFQKYLDRLQSAQSELEQALILYGYALSYSLRERILSLRSEMQIADRLLGFIDASDNLNDSNLSLISVTSQSVYDAVEEVLAHDTTSTVGVPIHAKDPRIK